MNTMTETETAWIITRDGRPTYGRYASESAAHSELLKRQPQSTDWAMKHEGWGIAEVPRDSWSKEEADQLRDTARRLFADHGHGWAFPDKEEEELTRENCGACALAGYGAHRENGPYATPNYAGWERAYVQAGRSVGPRFRTAFYAGLADDSNPAYRDALAMDLHTFGTPDGITEERVRESLDAEGMGEEVDES